MIHHVIFYVSGSIYVFNYMIKYMPRKLLVGNIRNSIQIIIFLDIYWDYEIYLEDVRDEIQLTEIKWVYIIRY